MPLYIIVADPGQRILPGVRYDCVDMFAGKSSMFTLAVVSLERLHAIAQPQAIDLGSLYHGYSYSLDSFIYGHINAGVATFLCLDKEGIRHRCYHQLINATAAKCFAYCLIRRKQSSSIHNNEVRARNDARLLRTSIIITVTFVFSWLPFEILTIVASLCISCQKHSFLLVIYPIKLLQYSNSFINFVIYCLRMPEFKRTLSKMLPSCKFIQGRCQVPYPLIDHGTGVALVSFASLRR